MMRFKSHRWRVTHRGLLLFFEGWYLIWFGVGLFAIGLQWPSYFYHIDDMLFMVLAGIVLGLHVTAYLGSKRTLIAFLWIALFSGTVEYVGTVTGFPFGDYVYTKTFGPRLAPLSSHQPTMPSAQSSSACDEVGEISGLAGGLPIAIPFAWWVVVFPLHVCWARVWRGKPGAAVLASLCVGLSAVAIDFALEPVATLVRSYWVWTGDDGIYYGVPLSNFVAWFAVASILSIGLNLLVNDPLRRLDSNTFYAFCKLPLFIIMTVLISFLVGAFVAGQKLAVGVILADCVLLTAFMVSMKRL